MAKPAGQDLQLPIRRSQIAIPWGNGVAPLGRRAARNVVEGSKSAAQLLGYPRARAARRRMIIAA
jgi:hypothetical protein